MKAQAQWGILTAVLLLAGLCLYQQPVRLSGAEADYGPQVGLLAPEFSLAGQDQKTYNLEQYRGKPVIINFWASWCAPCKEEAPALAKLHDRYGSDVQILAVNLTLMDSPEKAQAFSTHYGFKFPVLLDTEGDASAAYRIQPIPSTFFVDKNGKVTGTVLGVLDEQGWEEQTRLLLSANQALQ
ncbi:TlpA family protein disulfide reductase [Paenibacillus lutrae]|nr:TlpA disulfide reductase family protein [Paenibacillus lutrae]